MCVSKVGRFVPVRPHPQKPRPKADGARRPMPVFAAPTPVGRVRAGALSPPDFRIFGVCTSKLGEVQISVAAACLITIFHGSPRGSAPPRQGVRSRHSRQTGDALSVLIYCNSPCLCASVRNLMDPRDAIRTFGMVLTESRRHKGDTRQRRLRLGETSPIGRKSAADNGGRPRGTVSGPIIFRMHTRFSGRMRNAADRRPLCRQ